LSKGFRKIEGLEYDIYKEYEFRMMITLLSMNNNLTPISFKPDIFEKSFPPQYTFEIFMEQLANDYISKSVKVSLMEVVNRFIQLDLIQRFRYDS
jgi:hypothetical protein